MPAGSTLVRSSKVNISWRIFSAASRLRSSSMVMNWFSVARSRPLKISATISWLSRRWVRARFDMNSLRRVRSISSTTSFCTASMRSMRLMHSSEKVSGKAASTRAAWSGRILVRITATVCGYSFFR